MTIAQIVWQNERQYLSDDQIRAKLLNLFNVMDECIRKGVHRVQVSSMLLSSLVR